MRTEENRELIRKYIEDISGLGNLESLSVKAFLEHGKSCGSLLQRLELMLNHKEERAKRRMFRKYFENQE